MIQNLLLGPAAKQSGNDTSMGRLGDRGRFEPCGLQGLLSEPSPIRWVVPRTDHSCLNREGGLATATPAAPLDQVFRPLPFVSKKDDLFPIRIKLLVGRKLLHLRGE